MSASVQVPPHCGCRRYVGRVCLVTASTAGIGLAIAMRFAEEGGKVVVSSRKQDAVDRAVTLIRGRPQVLPSDVVGVVCQVNDATQRSNLLRVTVTTFGPIDVLVLNAAVSTYVGLTAATPARHFDKLFETNVRSAFLFVQEALPHMRALPADQLKRPNQFNPNILFVGSIAGYNPAAPIGIYGVTKTALIGLTKALSTELGPSHGIRVNLLAPGVVRTNFATILVDSVEGRTPALDLPPKFHSDLGRVGEPPEMAGVAAFLCSADASYMTGETIVAAGVGARL